jgi:hypothetical protein
VPKPIKFARADMKAAYVGEDDAGARITERGIMFLGMLLGASEVGRVLFSPLSPG